MRYVMRYSDCESQFLQGPSLIASALFLDGLGSWKFFLTVNISSVLLMQRGIGSTSSNWR